MLQIAPGMAAGTADKASATSGTPRPMMRPVSESDHAGTATRKMTREPDNRAKTATGTQVPGPLTQTNQVMPSIRRTRKSALRVGGTGSQSLAGRRRRDRGQRAVASASRGALDALCLLCPWLQ